MEKVKKPIYKRGWFIVICVIVILGAIGSAIGGGEGQSRQSQPTEEASTVQDAPESESDPSQDQSEISSSAPEESSDPEPEADTITMGQKNALSSAKSYLNYSAFSYTGLIKQLEFEKFSNEDAVYAADNCGADWNEQAAKCAKSYLEYSSFSRDGLIDQLEFEGFTYEQAVYGVEANGY